MKFLGVRERCDVELRAHGNVVGDGGVVQSRRNRVRKEVEGERGERERERGREGGKEKGKEREREREREGERERERESERARERGRVSEGASAWERVCGSVNT